MPKEKTENKSIRMSDDQYTWIRQTAHEQGISQAEVIAQMISAVKMGEMAQATPERVADINTFRHALDVLSDLYRSTVYAEQHAKEIAKDAYVDDLAAKDDYIVDLRAQCDSYAAELKTAEADCKAARSEAEIAKAAAESAQAKIEHRDEIIQSKDHAIAVLQAEVDDLLRGKEKYEDEIAKLKDENRAVQEEIFRLSLNNTKLQTQLDFYSQQSADTTTSQV